MKYTIIFSQNGIKKRTVVEADSEYYARRKLLDKASGKVIIDTCVCNNPFDNAKNIIDFLNGFRK